MTILKFVFGLAALSVLGELQPAESLPADAMLTEHIRDAITRLENPVFAQREAAMDELFAMGQRAPYPLSLAAENGSHEVSVRAFDVLHRLYRGDNEPTYEAVEKVFQKLKRAENLAVAARALRYLENDSETRQVRAIAQFERLGGVINYQDPNFGGPPHQVRRTIEYFTVGRNWVGGDAGLEILGQIDDIHNTKTTLYIIRGVAISEESTQNLRAKLPFIEIQYRGPARLGVRSDSFQRDEEGCVVSSVDPGSAADRSGLQTSDVIIEIDGQPVNNFQKLIKIIETKEPGDKVPVVFRRGLEIQEVEAELLTWGKQTREIPAPR